MQILLPPSETKRIGGVAATSLDLDALRFSDELRELRTTALDSLVALSSDAELAMSALKLGQTQLAEVERNSRVWQSETMPAIERYTGVLYDALNPRTLSEAAKSRAAHEVLIHSALFGLIGAADAIPAYRLSHNSRLPALSLRRHWSEPISALLRQGTDTVILDLRSEAYAALGPLPRHPNTSYLRVVSRSDTGFKKALSHFNKAGKGEFVRALLQSETTIDSLSELMDWAHSAGIGLESGAEGELDLVV